MEVNKDAVCIVVVPKIGLVDIPGTPSKESGFGGNLQKARKQSDTECKHKQMDMLPFQNNCVFVHKFLKKIEYLTIFNA